jgi:Uncharacterized protein conserved in bacteria (DUF2334)/FG-GAP-like repeat
LRKTFYIGSMFLLLGLVVFFVLNQTRTKTFPIYQEGASWEGSKKMAVIRLEDVSPGIYNTRESLDKLEAIANYLYSEGVPFQVSIIPVYKDPGKNIEISIADTDNPQVREFIKTINYLRDKGGMIGLHGYTHQYLKEVTGAGFEFMEKGTLVYVQPAYAEERVRQALELMGKAGIPIDYWETPHYTATQDQYRAISKYFGLIYDPNPIDKKFRNISSWDSAGPDSESAIFIPAPLLNVTDEKDIKRIFSQLDKNDPVMLASFFYHPYQEFKSMYKVRAEEGYYFYAHETDSYLHRLINGFKERGYRFVSVYELIDFLPAQRVTNLSPYNGGEMLTGDIDGDGRSDLIAGNQASGCWFVTRSKIEQVLPRSNPQSFGQREEWLNNWGQNGSKDFAAGDCNGDGKKDLLYRDSNTGEIQVALSDGSKFTPQEQPWGSFDISHGTVSIFTGYFNKDSKEDLLFWIQSVGTAYVALSSDSGFSPAKVWLENWQDIADPLILTGDFSGDGKTDLAAFDKNSGAVKLALNDNSGFDTAAAEDSQSVNFVTGDRWQVLSGDFTGDGIDDILAYDRTEGKWEFILSKERYFYRESWPFVYCKDAAGEAMVGDFNGDKKFDLAVARHFTDNLTPVDIAVSVINSNNAP